MNGPISMLLAATATIMLAAPAAAAPSARQTPTPGPIKAPSKVELLRPDYRILGIYKIVQDGKDLIGANVQVQQKCTAYSVKAPYVTLEVIDPKTGKMLLLIGDDATGLKGDGKTAAVRLNFAKGFPQDVTLRATINPKNKIQEAATSNNFYQVNPGVLPLTYGDDFCDPAKWE